MVISRNTHHHTRRRGPVVRRVDSYICKWETFHMICLVVLPLGLCTWIAFIAKKGFIETAGQYEGLIDNW